MTIVRFNEWEASVLTELKDGSVRGRPDRPSDARSARQPAGAVYDDGRRFTNAPAITEYAPLTVWGATRR